MLLVQLKFLFMDHMHWVMNINNVYINVYVLLQTPLFKKCEAKLFFHDMGPLKSGSVNSSLHTKVVQEVCHE